MHDSNENVDEIAHQANKFAYQHKLAFEGRYDGKQPNGEIKYS